jgi:hypothetical protein
MYTKPEGGVKRTKWSKERREDRKRREGRTL